MNDQTPINPSRRRALRSPARDSPRWARRRVLKYAARSRKRIVVRDDGGIYTKAYGGCFYSPFTQKTGIEVIGVQANAEPVAQIKSMVDTKNYTWDMAKISQPAILLLTEGGKVYLEKHGLENDPNVQTFPRTTCRPTASARTCTAPSWPIAPTPSRAARRRSSWADFWNVKDFPAAAPAQASVRHAGGVADGCRRADLAALSVELDRALCVLDKIKPNVDVWWNSGAQAEQLLSSGEVDMIADLGVAPAERHMAGRACCDRVEPGHLGRATTGRSSAGTPNADACREFIKFASDVKRMARWCDYFPAGVTQPEAFKYIKPEVAKNCPPIRTTSRRRADQRQVLARQPGRGDRAFNSWILK